MKKRLSLLERGLRNRNIEPGIVLAAIPVILITLLSWPVLHQIREAIRKDLRENLQAVLKSTHEAIHLWAHDRLDDARLMTERPDFVRLVEELLRLPRRREVLVRSPQLKALRRMVEPMLKRNRSQGIFIIAPDLISVASMRDENIGTINLLAGKRDFLPSIFAGRSRLILPLRSDVALPGIDGVLRAGEPTMFVAVPVLDGKGRVIAAFTVRLSPGEDFNQPINIARIGESGETYAFNDRGVMLSESRFTADLRRIGLLKPAQRSILNLPLRDPGGNLLEGYEPDQSRENQSFTSGVRQAMRKTDGVNTDGYRDYRGVEVVGAWHWDLPYNFGLIFEIDREEAYATYSIIRNTVIFVLSVTVFFFLIFSALLIRRQRHVDEINRRLGQEIRVRTHVQEDLTQWMNRYEAAAASTEQILYDCDLKNNTVAFNANLYKILGYDPAEIRRGGPERKRELIHPDDLPQFDRVVERMKVTGERGVQTYKIRHRNGEYLTVEDCGKIIKDEKENPIRMIGFIRDITRQIADARELERSRNELIESQRIAHLGSWIWDVKAENLRWSDEMFRIFGRDARTFQPDYERFLEAVHPADRSMLREQAERALAGEGSYSVDHRIVRPDGSERIVNEQAVVEYDDEGHPRRMSGTVQDITERKMAEEKMRLWEKIFENTNEAILVTDTQAQILFVNDAFEEMSGFSRKEILGRNPRILKSGRHDEEFYRTMWKELTAKGHWAGEIWDRRKNGEIYPKWMNMSAVKDESGAITHYVAISSDITTIKETEERLEHMAHYDPLTDLPNRLLFHDRLQHAISQARRNQTVLAVMILDLDRFKEINDTLGHSVGDQLLVGVAARLVSRLRDSDTIARMGGDEFMVLLPEIDKAGHMAYIADQIIQSLADPFYLEGHEVFITTSIGIAVFPGDGEDMDTLIKNADAAMYQAKRSGKNNFQFFTESLNRGALENIALEAGLRRAIERGELYLNYQPRVAAQTGRLVGVEALVRWNHPEHGQISPAKFIPIAEDSGLIQAIGEFVLREACRRNEAWHREDLPHFCISVNLSARQMHGRDLFQQVRRILEETGLSPGCLELEITESVAMQDVEENIALLRELKNLGLKLAIDDFGTGYSSLSYLKRFPIDALKIDRSFVTDITVDPDDRAVVQSVIALGHALNLRVVAEGVETPDQLSFLIENGCDEIQGFFFSLPLAEEELRDFARKNQEEMAMIEGELS